MGELLPTGIPMTSNRTIRWIENLAEQELSIRSGDRVSVDLCTTKDEVLSVETSTFLRAIQKHVEYLAKLFNLRVQEEALQLRLTSSSEGGDGFALLRGSMRLCVTSAKPGFIQFACDKRLDSESRSSVMFSGTLEAQFGLFHEVDWSFIGNPVVPEQVARHYLTEFIQVSRPSNSH